MQSKYLGDLGDFAKHGLLRYLSGLTDPAANGPDLGVGLVWHLTPDACCVRDGRVLGYLRDTPANRRAYRACDPELWDVLRDIVECGRRCVHQIPERGILPQETSYYEPPLAFPYRSRPPMRAEIRRLWFEGALATTADADVVCLDPDNGIAPHERQMLRRNGPKFTYEADIRAFWDRGQSLVIYQHLAMGTPAQEFLQGKADQLREFCGVEPIVLRLRSRAFFIVPQHHHQELITERAERMLAGAWGQLYECQQVGP